MSNNDVHLARYITIAADIAEKIVRGEYQEGQKVFGRSTLAGKYSVSPETIRRALTLLQEVGIVDVAPGIGVVVKSVAEAQNYLHDFDQRLVLAGIHEKLHQLVKERDRLNNEISKLMEELLQHTYQLESRLNKIEEWKVLTDSPLVGKMLAETELNDSRVLAILRKGQGDIIDPSPDSLILAGDILTIYGRLDTAAREGLVRL
ncbi:GntR family transcriptional regulator [Desulforamulus reducens]|uniref:GntR family transcriptional regulator n=1 Tax=Desulforamulus reducens TaxID=59610 RepID=UPI00030A1809|nr:GntR family transcriptional regulator [Desulforamulus reducens]